MDLVFKLVYNLKGIWNMWREAAGYTSLKGWGFQAGDKNGSWNHGMDENDQMRRYSIKSLGQTLKNIIWETATGKDASKWDQKGGISLAKMIQIQQGECGVTETKPPQGGAQFYPQSLLQNAQV